MQLINVQKQWPKETSSTKLMEEMRKCLYIWPVTNLMPV